LKINAPHTKTENASSDIFGTCFYLFPVGKNPQFLEHHPRNIYTKFGSNWPSGFKEEDYNF
jgi:hypothetical protein